VVAHAVMVRGQARAAAAPPSCEWVAAVGGQASRQWRWWVGRRAGGGGGSGGGRIAAAAPVVGGRWALSRWADDGRK
jgi:hypothetical protein